MPLRSDWSAEQCPIRRSLDVLGDGWVLLIVRDVLQGHGRFDELRTSLGVSEAVLSRRLHVMVEAGLLERVPYESQGRRRLAYAATTAAAELLPVIQQLAVWGDRHTTMPGGGGPMRLVHRSCGQETTQGEVCSSCGHVLRSSEMRWLKTWRGAATDLVGPGALAEERTSEESGR